MDEDCTSLLGDRDSSRYIWTRCERRRWFITLFLGSSALYASRSAIPLIIPAVTEELHWTITDSGAILSSFYWGYMLTQVLGGYLSDRIGGHRVLCISSVGWSLITLCMPQVINSFDDYNISFYFTLLFRVLHGAFQGVHFPAMSSLTSQYLEDVDSGSFFSVISSGQAIGMMVTGLFGSFILELYGWHSVLYLIGSLSILWTFILNYYSIALIRKESVIFMPSKLHSTYNVRGNVQVPVPWFQLLREKSFWSMVIAHACQTNGAFLLMSWIPTFFHDTFPETKGWIMNTVPVLFAVPSTVLSMWLTKKLIKSGYTKTHTRKIIQVVCFGGQSFALLTLGFVSTSFGALVCASLSYVFGAFHNSGIHVNPQDLAPKHAGSVFGVMNTVGAMQGFFGIYMAGLILDLTNSWIAVFFMTSAVYMFGCALFVTFGSTDSVI